MDGVFVAHPAWCDRSNCSVTRASHGTHFSARLVLEPHPRNRIRASVRITEGRPVPGYPESGGVAVELMMTFPCFDSEVEDDEYYVVLPGERAYALGRMLVSAGRQASAWTVPAGAQVLESPHN